MQKLIELLTARTAPSESVLQSRGQRIEGLEAVRAIAALAVVIDHAFSVSLIDDSFYISPLITNTFFGHAAVLLFFVLSGYVIGLATNNPFSTPAVRLYALKRIARLYPIYLVGLLLGWATGGPANLTEAVGNLLMFAGLKPYFGVVMKPPVTNPALWSIAYEAVYYVVFVALWAWKPRWGIVFCIAGFLSLFSLPLVIVPVFLSSWASGFLFWAAGLWLAWNAVRGATLKRPLLSWFLLLIAINRMGPILYPAAALFKNKTSWPIVTIADIVYIPACLLIICDAAGIVLSWRRVWIALAFLLPLLGLAEWFAGKGLDVGEPRVRVAIGVLVAAGALYRVRGTLAHIRWLAWLGACSYGIYAIHYPILWMFKLHFPWDGSLLRTGLGVAIFFLIVIGGSYLLESTARRVFLDPLRGKK
ncbi:hypothetical protein BH09SUM1_BH09SUM1_32140 [soil metagenome]